jgi:hypothetical protein
MKTETEFIDNRNKKIIVWHEDVNGNTDYWKKEDGISYSMDRKEYNKIIIKKVLNLDHTQIASMFGYENAASFTTASRRENVENGIVELYEHINFDF